MVKGEGMSLQSRAEFDGDVGIPEERNLHRGDYDRD